MVHLTGHWRTGLALTSLLILFLCFYSVHVPEYKTSYKASTTSIPIDPVDPRDWNEKLPTYNMAASVTDTEWWTSAAFIQWDLQNRPVDYHCRLYKAVGNWWICMDKVYRIKPPCLVYSFGIGFDFSFDDAMADIGCKVYSFDPSMKMREHIRNTSVHFYPIGLSNTDTDNFLPRKDMYVKDNSTWKVMTLESIMTLLDHRERHIDVLKIDVEGYEWPILEYLLQNDYFPLIKQFMLEYHLFPTWPSKGEYPKLLKIYKSLHDNGLLKFVTAMHPSNHKPQQFNIQADVAYVNTIFDTQTNVVYKHRI